MHPRIKTKDNEFVFDHLDEFYLFLRKFNAVRRAVFIPNESRYENCAEHSYQLSMMCWYFCIISDLKYDLEKILLYALVHDLVETHAGDTPVYNVSKSLISSKKKREHRAYEQIRHDFPEAIKLHNAIKAYETRSDQESKLVFAIDKTLPLLGNVYDCGRQMQKEGITLPQIIQRNMRKVAISKPVFGYYRYLLTQLNRYV